MLFYPGYQRLFMRGTALILRLRRALIPAYANANVKICRMGKQGLTYPGLVPILSRLKPSPRTSLPDFLEKNKIQYI